MAPLTSTFGQFVATLMKLDRWLEDNKSEARKSLPCLLELSGPELSQELQRHPELQPGLSRLLLEAAEETVSHDPARAHELTAAVIEFLGSARARDCREMEPSLRANAWTVHASALRSLERPLEALAAITAARDACLKAYVSDWSGALGKVVEGQILHDMGESAEALRLIRSGAEVILLHGDVKRYVQVRMYEALILWDGGERTGAAEVWRTMAREAAQRGDTLFMAVLENAIAVFQLRHGGAEAAAGLFEIAHGVFDQEGLTGEAIQARRGMAEAAVARGRINEGISEYYKVKALALAAGNLRQAALAAAEIVELVLPTGRNGEIEPLADSMTRVFAHAGHEHAMHTWLQVRQFAMFGRLTPSDVQGLRSYFQRFVL